MTACVVERSMPLIALPTTTENRETGATRISFMKAEFLVPDDRNRGEYRTEEDRHPEDAREDELRIGNSPSCRDESRHPSSDKEKPEERPGDRRKKPALLPNEFFVFAGNDNVNRPSLYHAVSCRNAQTLLCHHLPLRFLPVSPCR